MSFLDVIDPKTEIGDHFPITKLLADHRTEKGGWQEWSVGCICGGFYDRGVPGKWFIPSEASALRLYNHHLKASTHGEEVCDEDEDEEPTIPAEPWDLLGVFL